LTVESFGGVEALGALEPEWRDLSDAYGAGLPFRTWEWHDSWWRHLAEHRLGVEDAPRVQAFRDRSGRLVAVAPLMLTRRPGSGPLAVRAIDFLGADPNITELRGLLCDPAWEREVHAALLAQLRARAEEWDWLYWRGIRSGGELERALSAEPDVQFLEDVPNYVLPLEGTWEKFRASRSRNLKESLRKCYNSLKRDGHRFGFAVAIAPAEVAAALERFWELHGARARLGGTVRHLDVFAAPPARAFLADVCQRLALRGQVRVFQLLIEDQVVAARIGFALGDSLYLYYSGYDPRWAPYSVMTTALAEAIKHALEAGVRVVNLSNGTDVSKTRWSPQEVVYRSAVQLSPTRRGRLAYRAWNSLTRGVLPAAWREAARSLLGRQARPS
jgi:CelD/BcsL family acetyltransferase involved in cellulose biosynthesis